MMKKLYAMMFLLMVGAQNSTWAATVTYHILTLPIDPSTRYDYKMVDAVTGHRLEAIRVVVEQTSVELPAQFKSPLATDYTYYEPKDITVGSVTKLFANTNNPNKGVLYDVKVSPAPEPVAEGTPISGTTAEYYVVYTYNASNTIAKLDGTVNYNIGIKGKGFLAYNRGRNNRPAVMPKGKVDADVLTSEDFTFIDSPGAGIGTYWSSGDNKNKKEDVESQFHFIFKFDGKDPYNIIIRTAYNRETTYIEKNDNTSEFVYKFYKESSLFASRSNDNGSANAYFASDEH